MGAVNHSRPVNVLYGTVESESPLSIRVTDSSVGFRNGGGKLLTSEFLVLSRNVTDHVIEMEVNHQTEKMQGGGKDPSFRSHNHQYKGVKPFKVLNRLKTGEKVILIAMQGGQEYIVLDRIGESA